MALDSLSTARMPKEKATNTAVKVVLAAAAATVVAVAAVRVLAITNQNSDKKQGLSKKVSKSS